MAQLFACFAQKLAPAGENYHRLVGTVGTFLQLWLRFFIEDLIFMAKKCWGQGKSEQNSLSTNTEAFFCTLS